MVASFSSLGSASATTSYFEKDGYYARDDPEHRKASFWYGRGAEALGLATPRDDPDARARHIDAEQFQAILEGYVPDTDIRLGHKRDGEHKHRPGFDLTLSAPKSVSLAALLHGDKRVIAAHDAAVKATLDHVEQNYLQVRIHDPATGRKPRFNTPHLIAGIFRHEASRNLDPQLHSHAVIANMTYDAEGRWRSVEPTEIFQNKKLLGAFYRNELAGNLIELGYKLDSVQLGTMQSFEIAGYDKALRDAFSTRRQDILKYMNERGWERNEKMAQRAALITRWRKNEPDRALMHAQWGERLAELQRYGIGIGITTPRRTATLAARVAAMNTPDMRNEIAQGALAWALAHLEERKTVFTHPELVATALSQTPGKTGLEEIESGLTALKNAGRVIDAVIPDRRSDRGMAVLTTDRAIETERDILRRLEHARGGGGSIPVTRDIEQTLTKDDLTSGQQDAIRTILKSDDKIIGIQGRAGTGKTHMLNTVVDLAEDAKIFGLAPTASAARTLEAEAQIPAGTMQGFLMRNAGLADGSMDPARVATIKARLDGAIIVVDEASLASAVEMRDLLRITEKLDLQRLVLVGDTRQLNGVGAGAPFRLMQQAGMETASMRDIVRQRDPLLKDAVHEASLGRGEAALEMLKESVIETTKDSLAVEAAERWLDLGDRDRADTLLIAPTRYQRDEINAHIRETLVSDGSIGGDVMQITRLDSWRMTRAQKQDPSNYHEGDRVVFAVDSNRAGLKANQIYIVAGHDEQFVTLIDGNGGEHRFDPGGGIVTRRDIASRLDVFDAAPMTLQKGDRIRWTRNDNERGLINAHQAEVTGITVESNGQSVRMRTDDGRNLSLDHSDPQLGHCDYAFASTAHGAQGRTAGQVIAVMDSDHAALSNQKTFYVEISRARDGVTIVTDDRLQLADTLAGNSGEMVSALEAIGEIKAREAPATPATSARDVNHDRVTDNATTELMAAEPMLERHDEPPPPTHEAEYGEEIRLEPIREDGSIVTREREPEPTEEKTKEQDIGMEMGL